MKKSCTGQSYTIQQLVELSGVSRRTIHHYVREGLVPRPTRRGRGATYASGHLDRLVLIRALREQAGLGLTAIGQFINALSPDDLRRRVRNLSRGVPPDPVASVRPILRTAADCAPPPGRLSSMPPPGEDDAVRLWASDESSAGRLTETPTDVRSAPEGAGACETTCTRIAIAPGIVLEIEADVDDRQARVARNLAFEARRRCASLEPTTHPDPEDLP